MSNAIPNTTPNETLNTTAVLVERSQFDPAIRVLSDAFAHDPIFDYLLPESEPERTSLRQLTCSALLRCSLSYQQVYTTPDLIKGVAAWVPPGHAPVSLMQLLKAGLYSLPTRLGWRHLLRWSVLLKWDYYHRQDMPHPHWYLMLLGVSPDYQRQGVGSLILQPILDQADRDDLPCYLETSTESAVQFYQRHGFNVLREEQLTQDAPTFWTMTREPRSHNKSLY